MMMMSKLSVIDDDDDDESCSIRHRTDVPRPPSKVYPLPTGPIPRAVEVNV